jgi:hypothetical protein
MSQFTTLLNRTSFTHSVQESGGGERLRGEWWIIDGGAQFADQDVGEMGHEGMAIQRITNDLLDALDIRGNGESILLSEYESEIEGVVEPHEGEEFTVALTRWLKENADPDTASNAEEMVNIAWSGCGDAREYALEHWGWQRVKGNTAETYTLTQEDLGNLSSGLGDVRDEEGVTDEEFEFDIYVMSGQKWFTGVPYSVIQKGDLAGLREYDQSFRTR